MRGASSQHVALASIPARDAAFASIAFHPLEPSPMPSCTVFHRIVARTARAAVVATVLAVLPLSLTAQVMQPSATASAAGRPDTVARHAPGARSTHEQGVVAAVRALFAAAERADIGALDTLYAGDSLTVVEGTGINRGWVDYRDRHLGPELKTMRNFRYRPFELEVRVHGDIAWVLFRYALQGEHDGRAVDNVGRGTAILERRGERWVVRHTQTTSRARRPGDPAMPQS